MSREEKNARNLRQREARQKKKGAKYFLFVMLQMDYMQGRSQEANFFIVRGGQPYKFI